MVFGLLTAVAAAPAIVGTTEAVRQGQKNNQREEHRGRKYNLSVTLLRRSPYRVQFDGALIVLKDNKLYVDARKHAPSNERFFPATSYYLPWPHGNKAEEWKAMGYAYGEGYVTTINDQNFLNWVFVDSTTHEVKYGVRAEAEPHRVGPWDCTKVERRLTFEGWEGFIAVQEEEGDDMWALYFDCSDDGLRKEGQPGKKGKKMLELQVWRKEPARERVDALHERLERLELREEQDKEAEHETADMGRGDFDDRLNLQRNIAQKTYATDFQTKLEQQREIGRNMFTKR